MSGTEVGMLLPGGGNSSIGDTGIKLMRELTARNRLTRVLCDVRYWLSAFAMRRQVLTQRMVLGNPEYEFGDLSKKLVKVPYPPTRHARY
eukprot:3940385-Rhodomonas_salina.2